MNKLYKILPIVLLAGCSSVQTKQSTNRTILDTPVRTHLPNDIKTNHDAVSYYLEGTGYTLTTSNSAPIESNKILKQKAIYRGSDQVMKLDKAILRIFKKKVNLIIDHENKLVSVGYAK